MEYKKYLPSLEMASGISKLILVILGIFFMKLWGALPPDLTSMTEVEGEVVVIDPSYAHIKFNEKVVRVEYKCLCNKGWKEKNLENSKHLKAKVSMDNKDYKAWVLFLDNNLVFDGTSNRVESYALTLFSILLALICIVIIFAENRKKKADKLKWMAIDAELNKVVDHDIPVEDRIKVIHDLVSSKNIDLIFPLANIGMLNTLPDTILSALGDSIGRLIIIGDLPIDDVAAQEMLGFLQPATKQAVMSRLADTNTGDNVKNNSINDANFVSS